jgi:hypothetical protein
MLVGSDMVKRFHFIVTYYTYKKKTLVVRPMWMPYCTHIVFQFLIWASATVVYSDWFVQALGETLNSYMWWMW